MLIQINIHGAIWLWIPESWDVFQFQQRLYRRQPSGLWK